MNIRRVALVACAAGVGVGVSSVDAAITTIGEFVGDASETFENIGPPGPYPGGMTILAGEALFDDEFTDPWITGNLSDGMNNLFAYDGAFMGLTPTGLATFDFDTPVTQFGGFFAHLSQNVSGGTITFLDEQGGTIEVLPLAVQYNDWNWFGWQSDTPIAAIQMDTNQFPGATTVYDNLQITVVPAQAALAVLAFGALLPGRRRR